MKTESSSALAPLTITLALKECVCSAYGCAFGDCALGIDQAGHRDVCAIITAVGVVTSGSVSFCVNHVGTCVCVSPETSSRCGQ